MFHRKVSAAGAADIGATHPGFRSACASAAAGTITLAAGGLVMPLVTAHLGLFPTLFVVTVIAVCVGRQVAELTAPHQPQH
jgi:hypothetical protein